MYSVFKFLAIVITGLTLSLMASSAHADVPLAGIEIDGQVSEDLRELLATVIGRAEAPPRSLAQARRRVENAAEQALSVMRSQGYYGAEIKARIDEFTAEGDATTRIPPQPFLMISPGTQFTFGERSITYKGTPPDITDSVEKVALLSKGTPALAAKVVAAEILAINHLKANGYPEATALPREAIVDHDTKTMRLKFHLSAGDKTRFGEIKQTGSAYIIQSWPKLVAPFKPGDLFNDRELNKLPTRIISTGVFDSTTAVLEEEKTPNADGTVTRNILLNVEQGNINTITGELGYSTTDGSGINLSYERRNFIGYAQTLTLSSTLKTNQIKFGIDYNIPYMFRDDRSLDLSTEIAREDTDAFVGERVGGSALITQKISSRLKVGVGIGLEASRFEENGVDQTAYLVDGLATATYDSRNSLLDPVKGTYAETSAIPTYNFGDRDGLFTTVNASASHYKRVSDSLVVAGRVKAGTIFGADQASVPLNRRFYGGGGGSVRGFGYQSISPVNNAGDFIGGRSLTEANVELRYRGDSAFGGVVFVDAGSVVRDDLPNLTNIRYGAGVGLRYYTSFAPLRADIAIPLNRRPGDSRVQVYISIGQAF